MRGRPNRLGVVLGVLILLLAGGLGLLHHGAPPARSVVDRAVARFWNAADCNEAARAALDITATGVTFDEVWARLKQGRPFSNDVARGLIRKTRRTPDGLEHLVLDVVPDDYNAAHSYPVRVQLHGGVNRPRPDEASAGLDRIRGRADEIEIHPVGWAKARWWDAVQVENILGALDEVKRVYNVDENRVYLTGISDGGTGTYFMAFRETTPWASFLPLIGDMGVLADAGTRPDGEMHPGNAVNKPFFVVNSGQDRLYPATIIEPDLAYLRRLGVQIVYHPQPEAGHDTSWWPVEQANFEGFVREHPRKPYPDRLSWETERTDRYNRAHWLIIDALGSVPGETTFTDESYLFPHTEPSGRVDVVRQGNKVEASTQGVREFTLLLSPDVFDFGAPVQVVVNGRMAFAGRVEKRVATLLKWASQDNDRTMLFGAELRIEVPGQP